MTVGSPELGHGRLKATDGEAERVRQMPDVLGRRPTVRNLDRAEMLAACDGGAALIHCIGHGLYDRVGSGLPLASGEMSEAADLARLRGLGRPFVFLCACEGARVRHGAGGHQSGLASSLTERLATVLAFTMPIPEKRACETARRFHRNNAAARFGEAVRRLAEGADDSTPASVRLSAAAHGDPPLRLETDRRADAMPAVGPWHARSFEASPSAAAGRRGEAGVA